MYSPHRSIIIGVVSLAWLMLLADVSTAVDDEYDEHQSLGSGLIATYSNGQDDRFQRVDRRVSFVWDKRAPDPRLDDGVFRVQWRGTILTQVPGEYRLYAFASGRIRIRLNNRTLLEGSAATAQWLAASPVELSFGWHSLEVDYEKTNDEARVALYWSGPNFQLEPIGRRFFFHDRSDAPADSFRRGRRLTRALRCAACHLLGDVSQQLAAPALDGLAGNVHSKWLVEWLAAKASTDRELIGKSLTHRRMPFFALSIEDARAISAFLLARADGSMEAKEPAGGDSAEGQQLLVMRGCLACHRVGELGESGLFGGGDLSQIASKRPRNFFSRWLADPDKINRNHRMPVFDLDENQRADIAAFLGMLGNPAQHDDQFGSDSDPRLVEQGRSLYQQLGCAACHQSTADDNIDVPVKTLLAADADWDKSCVGRADRDHRRPGYFLLDEDRHAVRQFVTGLAGSELIKREQDAELLLAEHNCLACHARDGSQGLAAHIPSIVEAHPELAQQVPAMTPPSLDSVGDKLHRVALSDAIQRGSRGYRSWLSVRMPKFPLTDQQLNTLVHWFVAADRVPDGHPESRSVLTSPRERRMLELAGPRLVSSDGFGCTSCHAIGRVNPHNTPLNALGPNLALLDIRVRRPWFDRWVRDPARIAPRIEMPAIQQPVHGVLDDKLDDQLAAVWHVLNQSDFRPPRPNPFRILRRSGDQRTSQPAVFVTDVVHAAGQTYIKPLLVGLPNRHSVLFDLETNRLARWGIGDMASQRPQGKFWYWDWAATDLLELDRTSSDLVMMRDGHPHQPMLVGQFPTEIDSLQYDDGAIILKHRLQFPVEPHRRTVWSIVETLMPINSGSESTSSGVLRVVQIAGCQRQEKVRMHVLSARLMSSARISDEGRAATFSGGDVRVQLIEPSGVKFDLDGSVTVPPSQPGMSVRIAVRYTTSLLVDQFPIVAPVAPPQDPVALTVVPGFETFRLPVSERFMPTALAWRLDGTLVFSSLAGRVWLARDSDGDQLEDQITVFSDGFSAPFGVAAGKDYLDVIHKTALVRLFDDDRDGRADRIINLASGWGHTADYHDWSVGLPRDEQGNYYVATACQQDDRLAAAARWRGMVLKLVPREPTREDPHHYTIEPVSHGHRFPMGLARNRRGDLFVTDNQGNYNPFNELNHVVSGLHYGFINMIERKPGFKPLLTSPAVDIPHPWTRSVNGICFLETPAGLVRGEGEGVFGPFEGHLIGCEYDTRRLIRMSLQRVGDVVQGAAYPFSRENPSVGPSLLGPLAASVSPRGDLYVGCIQDSGWGGGNNQGTLVRMRPRLEQLPVGIAEVLATSEGFVIHFTVPVHAAIAADERNYSISSYTRRSTLIYGGPDEERRTEIIRSVEVSSDARQVTLGVAPLRAGFVYELRLNNLSGGDHMFFPAEAYYTMRRIPR